MASMDCYRTLGPILPLHKNSLDSLPHTAVLAAVPQRISWSPSLTRDPEAVSFVSRLSNYIALGCIAIQDSSPQGEITSWKDVELPATLVMDTRFTILISSLLSNGWIKVQYSRSSLDQRFSIFRIYILPEDAGLRFIDRRNAKLTAAVERLVNEVDTNPETWRGRYSPGREEKFGVYATADECSLFYIFNRIPSPAPNTCMIKEKYSREATEDLLDPAFALPGLKTDLYPYQRRCAALMLQRESVTKLEIDPRLERRTAPDGAVFFYCPREIQFLRDPRYFEAPRGGILAESMGLGKTLICLSLILATKHHPPKVPMELVPPVTRTKVTSLMDLAATTIKKRSIPWKVEVERLCRATGGNGISTACIQALEQPFQYEIPNIPTRWNRATVLPPPQRVTLASTTIIVVPRNLCRQWESEISKHIDGALQILVMDDPKKSLPPADSLRTYDVILFSRSRFDQESKHGLDDMGRTSSNRTCQCTYIGSSRSRNCTCVHEDSLYRSPLKDLHFKRLIIDEGHFFGQSNSNTVLVANRLVKSDHRWVVSGTPARDLLGVEMDPHAFEDTATTKTRNGILEQRRSFSDEDTKKNGAIDSLGLLASAFLHIKPWSSTGERTAVWKDHIYSGPRRAPTAFSVCLRRTLEGMVVKTRPDDVERDIVLPPLHHRIVRLTPSFYDKMTANMFTLVLTANAVTSERTDADYLFHKNSQKARYQLISNLRQSAFCWTGFSEADVEASIRISTEYLSKEGTGCSAEDRQLLNDALQCTSSVLNSTGWKSMSRTHELGVFVDQWPETSADHWAFDQSREPLLTGISQLLEAQQFVNTRLLDDDPGEGLGGLGVRALASKRDGTKDGSNEQRDANSQPAVVPIMGKLGVPVSSLNGEPHLRNKAKLSPPKPSIKSRSSRKMPPSTPPLDRMSVGSHAPRDSYESTLTPGSMSPYAKARVVGTTSAKMSYLISQIMQYHQTEKIIVFYQGDNIAYYIAQLLDLMHVKHEIYAKSLSAQKQSEYVVRFNEESHERVLLMDVNQAALGLNLCSASRIYFVNPVCRPNIEAQAIKRAHRIGQTRPVFVETLVLRGTIEERMLERSSRMTRSEHRDAKALEDDGGIREIIQSARRLDVDDSEGTTLGQMARLATAEQLWGRPGWSRDTVLAHDRKRKRAAASAEEEEEAINQKVEHHHHDASRADGTVPRKKRAQIVVPRSSGVPWLGVGALPSSPPPPPLSQQQQRNRSHEGDEAAGAQFAHSRGGNAPPATQLVPA